jgi:hypothetical protein
VGRPPVGIRVLGALDLVLLAIALPVFVVADLPLTGYAAAGGAWLVQRGIQVLITRRAKASGDLRTVAGLMTASMIGRAWIMALAVFGVGVADEDAAGLSAAVLAIALFTAYFAMRMAVLPFERGRAER